jgi:hypothetical protein
MIAIAASRIRECRARKPGGPGIMKPFPGLALIVLLAFVAMSLVMFGITCRFGPAPGADRHGLKPHQLGLAVELAASQSDFNQLVGAPSDSCESTAASNRCWLRRQQYLDFLFIALYVALFWILGGVEISEGYFGAFFLGAAARAAIVLAAGFDVMEDVAILRALRGDPFTQPIRTFGLPKWGFFFLAALLVSAWFLYSCFHSLAVGGTGGMDRALAGLTGLLLAAGGLLGLAGVIHGKGVLIGLATTYGIAPATLALLALMVLLRKGI